MTPPTPAEIRQWRQDKELTQTQAANLIWVTLNTWQKWEGGKHPMHPAFWHAVQSRYVNNLLDEVESGYSGSV